MRGGSSDCKILRPSHTLSLADMRAHKDEKHFTVKGYKTPKGETTGVKPRVRDCYTLKYKAKNLSFFDEHAKNKKMIPGPGKYQNTEHTSWMKRDIYMGACRPKGKVSDQPKVSSTEEIAKKKKAIPAPGKYKDHESWKKQVGKRVTGTQKYSEAVYTEFDEITYVRAKEVPAANKYKIPALDKTLMRSPNP